MEEVPAGTMGMVSNCSACCGVGFPCTGKGVYCVSFSGVEIMDEEARTLSHVFSSSYWWNYSTVSKYPNSQF